MPPKKPRPSRLTGRALGCKSPTGDTCYCKRGKCPAQIWITKLALALAATHAPENPNSEHSAVPLHPRALRSLVHDVKLHVGAGVAGLASLEATKQGAREAGYRVDARGQICGLRWDGDFYKRLPYWEDSTVTPELQADSSVRWVS